MFNPALLTKEQRENLFIEFPQHKGRIVELDKHSTDELAAYVAELSRSVPPNEKRPRFEIYGWSPQEAEHYRPWAKRSLIQRIVCMEKHDEARRLRQPVPGVMDPDAVRDLTKPIKIENSVQPPNVRSPSEPVRPALPPVSAGPVQAPRQAAVAGPKSHPVSEDAKPVTKN